MMHSSAGTERDIQQSGRIDTELSDVFYTSQKKSRVFWVKLNVKGFTLQRELPTGTDEQVVKMCDIIGSRCMRVQKASRMEGACTCSSMFSDSDTNKKGEVVDNREVSAYLYVFAYVLKKNLRSSLRRERTVLTLRFRSFDTFEENMQEAEKWNKALRWYKQNSLDALRPKAHACTRRLLVFLNPKSGSGKAREIFHKQVVPVFNEAELPYDLYVTKHANYASEFVRRRNITAWSGIVAVGGDGLFFEILNGLLQRPDWEDIVQRIPMGIIPCGSGNGLSRSIAYMYKEPYEPKPILGATLTVISGHTALMDVVRIETQNKIVYSFLSVGWGLISDVDIESERLRLLGYQRFPLWTLHRLISLRTYQGRISYLLKSGFREVVLKETPTLKNSRSLNTYFNKAECNGFQGNEFTSHSETDDIISLETSFSQSFRSRCDSWYSARSHRSTYYSVAESVYHSVEDESDSNEDSDSGRCFGPRARGPSLQDPVPHTWTVEEGEFIMVQAAYQTHLGVECFFAPAARMNDETIYLVIIRGGISRFQLFSFLYNMSSGTHIPNENNEFVKVVAVTSFRIEPYGSSGIITIDGERVEFGALQGEVLPGIASIMVPN